MSIPDRSMSRAATDTSRLGRRKPTRRMAASKGSAGFPSAPCSSIVAPYYGGDEMADDARHSELFDKGLAIRREVLGAEYVDRSIANADAFTQPFHKLVTELC